MNYQDDITISTHTPLAGRDNMRALSELFNDISTHTPLAGRDYAAYYRKYLMMHFYSHAPCGT